MSKGNVTIANKTNGSGVEGRLGMSEDVVETIAKYAATQVKGVHKIGKSGLNLNMDGKTLFKGKQRSGVDAEVGQSQAALDLEIIIEFGCDVAAVADELRGVIASAVKKMAGRDVVEINIDVVGIHMPEEDEPAPTRRVE
jgi:uncharacterized alkaline shock family protein YloU